MFQNNAVNRGILLEDFELAADWTLAGSGSTISEDTVNVKTGSKSIKITTAVATTTSVTKTISVTPTLAGNWGIWVYIDDVANISQLDVFLSSATDVTSKYLLKSFTAGSGALQTGWNFLPMPRDSWTSGNGELWTDTKVRLRLRVFVPAGKILNISLDSLYYNLYARPKVLITFDDGFLSAYTEGFKYMNQRELKATYYIISNSLALSDGSGLYFSLAQAQEMYANGCDIANHTTDHTNLTLYSQEDFNTRVVNCANYLINKNMPRSAQFLAYPGGSNNALVQAYAREAGILHARTVTAGNVPTIKGIVNHYAHKCYDITSGIALNTAKGYIDTAIINGETVTILFHKLVASPAASTEWAITDFQALMEHILQRNRQIDVVTMSEWYKQLTNPRRIVA